MSHATIDKILQEIESLSNEDREKLENRLAEIDELKWRQEASEAQAIARDLGVDQAEIDRRINDRRYR